MRHTQKYIKRFILFPLGVVALGLLAGVIYLFIPSRQPTSTPVFGVTFSTKYTAELGLDTEDTFIALLDDLQIRRFRIPIYWDELEAEPGTYQFEQIDWLLDQAAERQAVVTLAIGRRVPRWPECHPPQWTTNLPEDQIRIHELAMLNAVVEHFKDHPALVRWQVQNEGFLGSFGECPKPDNDFIVATITHVRQLDPNTTVMTTDSGELSSWFPASRAADELGISIYRETWNSFFGYFTYPIPPKFYTLKARFVDHLVDTIFVSELQAEPWNPAPPPVTSLDEQFRSMNPTKLANNIDYVERTGFSEVWLWGVEWWYWLKLIHNDSSMWEAARPLFIE